MNNLSVFIKVVCMSFGIYAGAQSDHQKTDLNVLHNYIDSVVNREMESFNVPGVTIAIVQDSQDVYINNVSNG